MLVQGVAGRAATGLKFNRGRLFVSGAATGKAFIYDAKTGALIREYQLATAPTFINDVAVTNDAAYFTDSNRAVIFKLPLGNGGTLPAAAQTLALTGDFQLVAGFNLNGIVASPDGKTLIAVQSNTGKLFTINPNTGATHLIDLGGATLMNGDGLLLHGKTLYVVQNQNNRIAVVASPRTSAAEPSPARSRAQASTYRRRSPRSGVGCMPSTPASRPLRRRRRPTASSRSSADGHLPLAAGGRRPPSTGPSGGTSTTA